MGWIVTRDDGEWFIYECETVGAVSRERAEEIVRNLQRIDLKTAETTMEAVLQRFEKAQRALVAPVRVRARPHASSS